MMTSQQKHRVCCFHWRSPIVCWKLSSKIFCVCKLLYY